MNFSGRPEAPYQSSAEPLRMLYEQWRCETPDMFINKSRSAGHTAENTAPPPPVEDGELISYRQETRVPHARLLSELPAEFFKGILPAPADLGLAACSGVISPPPSRPASAWPASAQRYRPSSAGSITGDGEVTAMPRAALPRAAAVRLRKVTRSHAQILQPHQREIIDECLARGDGYATIARKAGCGQSSVQRIAVSKGIKRGRGWRRKAQPPVGT